MDSVNEDKNIGTGGSRSKDIQARDARQMLGDQPQDLDEREMELWEKLSALYEQYCGNDETVWADRMASFEAVEGPLFRPIRKHMALGRRKAISAIQRSLNESLAIVAKWPEWKRGVLGPLKRPTAEKTDWRTAMEVEDRIAKQGKQNDYIAHLWDEVGAARDGSNFWTAQNLNAFWLCVHATPEQRRRAALKAIECLSGSDNGTDGQAS